MRTLASSVAYAHTRARLRFSTPCFASIAQSACACYLKSLLARFAFDIPPTSNTYPHVELARRHSSLRHYAVYLLQKLSDTKDAELIRAVCQPSKDLSKAIFPAFDASKLLLQNAHYFPGMTLTVSGDDSTKTSSSD
eukprot:4131462-Pleurochrysis_carterae.AAC.2